MLKRISFPVGVIGVSVLWTAAVYPFSSYGDNWAIVPILVLYLLLILYFLFLVWKTEKHKFLAAAFSFLALIICSFVFFYELMLISKDSL